MAFIEVRNLAVEFTRVTEDGREVAGKRAIDGIDLDIEKGSFVVSAEDASPPAIPIQHRHLL